MRSSLPNPPKIAGWLLERFLSHEEKSEKLGDFEEGFRLKVIERGAVIARAWFWLQVCKVIPIQVKHHSYWRLIMFMNYVKTSLRVLMRQRGYSLLNIFGLATGFAGCLLIFLYVQHELSYDRFHENADRIHRVVNVMYMGDNKMEVAGGGAPMAQALKEEFPEVEETVRLRDGGIIRVKVEEAVFKEDRIVFSDPSIFKVFSLPLVSGDPKNALNAPEGVIISQSTAKKYFGSADPLGRTFRVDDTENALVTGVFKDIPEASHFHFDLIFSMAALKESRDPSWSSWNFKTYILLRKDARPQDVESKLLGLIQKHMEPQIRKMTGKSLEETMSERKMRQECYLQALTKIHLFSDVGAEFEPNSDIRYLYVFSAIALFILVIAVINFMNLSTARSSGRAKEVGLRKVMGSGRSNLVRQFLTESLILSLVSLLIALLLIRLSLESFNHLTGKNLEISGLWGGMMIGILFLTILLSGILAGSYPALLLSSFSPVNALKGRLKRTNGSGMLRGILVVFQFTASTILIIGTLVVFNQLHFIRNKKVGFNKNQVIVLNNTYRLGKRIESFKNEMLQLPYVIRATVGSYLPVPSSRYLSAVDEEGTADPNKAIPFPTWPADYDYLDTLEIKILQGRNFSREFATDKNAVVINQAAVRHFGWDSALGKRLVFESKTYEVIGVVEDFHFESLRNRIGPWLIFLGESSGRISFRVGTDNLSNTITRMRKKWESFAPGEPFEYWFLDERFYHAYRSEQKIGQIGGVFAGLAVLIGCLGLFGLAAFTAEKRTKEVGIRKILGASVTDILRLMVKEYLILISIANLLAWPVAYFLMQKWLQAFAYRTSLEIWIFIAAGTGTLFIALLTVGFQAGKASFTDPVKTLRYE